MCGWSTGFVFGVRVWWRARWPVHAAVARINHRMISYGYFGCSGLAREAAQMGDASSDEDVLSLGQTRASADTATDLLSAAGSKMERIVAIAGALDDAGLCEVQRVHLDLPVAVKLKRNGAKGGISLAQGNETLWSMRRNAWQ